MQHLPIPRKNVIAMLNADMIGRDDTQTIHIVGPQTAESLKPLVENHHDFHHVVTLRETELFQGMFQRQRTGTSESRPYYLQSHLCFPGLKRCLIQGDLSQLA